MPVDQVYVKAEDGKQSVGKYVESVAKTSRCKRCYQKVSSALRPVKVWKKKEENFAEEVAKQMNA